MPENNMSPTHNATFSVVYCISCISASKISNKIPRPKENLKNQFKTEEELEHEISIVNLPTLNIFENVTYWAQTEETVFNLAKKYQRKLKTEIWMLREQFGLCNLLMKTSETNLKLSQRTFAKLFLPILTEISYSDYDSSRFYELLFQITQRVSLKPSDESSRSVDGYDLVQWPNMNDLEFAMYSLIHIVEVYNFNLKELPIHLSPETNSPPQFHAVHCVEIGMHALYIEHYAAAIQWMEHGLEKANGGKDFSISLLILQSNLKLAVELHNEILAAEINSKSGIVENLFQDFVSPVPFTNHRRERRVAPQVDGKDDLESARRAAFPQFDAICSGKNKNAFQQRSALYCWYDKTSSPVRTILPFKKEQISIEPEVIQVYDILGDKQISKLLKYKAHCAWFAHSLTVKSFSEMARSRTSSICMSNSTEMELILRKASSLTLTDLRAAGSYDSSNVNNYLFGRFHSIHLDALQLSSAKQWNKQIQEELATMGDRFISLIIYLNDVPAGGSTAFPTEWGSALPVKGSVVIWKNLYRNGSARVDTLHGGCPVIYGHKLAAILQIHYNSQFLTYPCTLNRNE